MPTNTLNIDFVKFKDFHLRSVDSEGNVKYTDSLNQDIPHSANSDEYLVGYRTESGNPTSSEPEFRIPLSEVLNSNVQTSGGTVDLSDLHLKLDNDKLYLYEDEDETKQLGAPVELNLGGDEFDVTLLSIDQDADEEKKFNLTYKGSEPFASFDLSNIDFCDCDIEAAIRENLKLSTDPSSGQIDLSWADSKTSFQTAFVSTGSGISNPDTYKLEIDQTPSDNTVTFDFTKNNATDTTTVYLPEVVNGENSDLTVETKAGDGTTDPGRTIYEVSYKRPDIVASCTTTTGDGELTANYDSETNKYKIQAKLPVAGSATIIEPSLNEVMVTSSETNSGSFVKVDGTDNTYDLKLNLETLKGDSVVANASAWQNNGAKITFANDNGTSSEFRMNVSPDEKKIMFEVFQWDPEAPHGSSYSWDKEIELKSITSSTSPLKDSNGNTIGTTVTFSDGTSFDVKNGKNGVAKSIAGIGDPVQDENDPLKYIYTIYYTDGTTDTFTVTNGKDGETSQYPIIAATPYTNPNDSSETGTKITIVRSPNDSDQVIILNGKDGEDVSTPQVNADWNATSGVAKILNKPELSAVATSGSYNDLTNTPDIPYFTLYRAIFANPDWDTSGQIYGSDLAYAYKINYEAVRFQKYNLDTLVWEFCPHQRFLTSVKHSKDIIECYPDSYKGEFNGIDFPGRVAISMMNGIFAMINGKGVINGTVPIEEMNASDYITLFACTGPNKFPIGKANEIVLTIKVYTNDSGDATNN